jgi:hypothetical protein
MSTAGPTTTPHQQARTYEGRVRADGERSVWVYEALGARLLPLRLDAVNHSPTGFAWGYGGSGPAQLAFALIAYELGDATARRFYQAFKFRVIGRLPLDDGWRLSGAAIRNAIADIAAGVPEPVERVGP